MMIATPTILQSASDNVTQLAKSSNKRNSEFTMEIKVRNCLQFTEQEKYNMKTCSLGEGHYHTHMFEILYDNFAVLSVLRIQLDPLFLFI